MDIKKDNNDDLLRDSEKRLKFILGLSDSLRPISNATEIQRIITEKTRKYFQADRCYYAENIQKTLKVRQDASAKGLKSIIGVYDRNRFPKLIDLIAKGEPLVIENINTEDMISMIGNEIFMEHQITACIIVPVIKEKRFAGILIIGQIKPRKWEGNDVKLAIDIANRTWDAVERARISEEKEKLISQLRRNQERLMTIIDSIDAEVWVRDSLDRVTLISRDNQTQSGTPIYEIPQNILAKDYDFLNMDGSPTTINALTIDRALKGETVVSEGMIYNRKTHELMYNEYRISPIIDKDEKIKEVVIINTNIEERIKMRQALEKREKESSVLVEELGKVDELRKGFLSSLSHELRNPLATIALGLDLMNHTEGNKEEQRKTRETLERQTQQLIRLIDDLLDMARITQNIFELHLEEMELNKLLEEIMKDNYFKFNEKNISLESNILKEKIIIQGDKPRLRQVIENILNNSLKFTPEAGKVTITLKKDKAANEAIISIKDTGKGIPPDISKIIFEPYVQARNSQGKSPEGLGIGLSIVKDIVERHKGSVRAINRGENMGTEMIIRLPILQKRG